MWLLDVNTWTWQEIEVRDSLWEAPQLWCHPAVKVGHQVVVFSLPKALAQTEIVFEYNAGGNRRERRDGLPVHSGPHRGGVGGTASSSSSFVNLQTYVLDCSEIFTTRCVAWKPTVNNSTAPPAFSLHSVVVCRGEILIFGGIQNSRHVDACSIQGANNNLIVVLPANKEK